MSLLDEKTALEIAEEIVAVSTATETEVTVDSTVDRFVRYADSGPTQSADRERCDVSVRVRLAPEGANGFHEARACCGSLEPGDTQAAIARAVALAQASPLNEGLTPLGGPTHVRRVAADEDTVAHGFEEKATWVKRAVAACTLEGLAPAGLIETTGHSRAIVNSAGRRAFGSVSRASMSLTATGPNGSGWGERIVGRVAELDADAVIERAVQKAIRSRDPVPIEPGDYTVVLEPAAVSAFLLFASYHGFGAREVEEQASFLCERMGSQAFSKLVSIRDDAQNPVYPRLPFDGEGTPKSAVKLVDSGCLGRPVTDSFYAAKTGEANTGHALPQPSAHGPAARNLYVEAGTHSLDELVAGVERGLLVTQFHYTNMIEPRELLLTGMTRNGTFLIEDGRLVGAVRNLRFTQSLVEAMANVTGVGDSLEVSGALFDGELVAPAMRIDKFRFTSSTEF